MKPFPIGPGVSDTPVRASTKIKNVRLGISRELHVTDVISHNPHAGSLEQKRLNGTLMVPTEVYWTGLEEENIVTSGAKQCSFFDCRRCFSVWFEV
jgi:hypothetical protein